jgi:hypothetical protein
MSDTNEDQVFEIDEEKRRRLLAFLYQLPSFTAAEALGDLYSRRDEDDDFVSKLDFGEMRKLLAEQSQAVSSGDLSRLEALLCTQAHVLNGLFTRLVGIAQRCDSLEQYKTYLGLGLKAQNQTRQTIAALAELKSPKRSTFISQQNNAVNQQINQGEATSSAPKAPDLKKPEKLEKVPTRSNELLEIENERMDDRAPTTAK